MPNTREKLIELLEDSINDDENVWLDDPYVGFEVNYDNVADHLIAKGVTVQKWIPVTERLPEDCDNYLVVVKYKYDSENEYNIDVDVATYYPFDCEDYYIDKRWSTMVDWDEGQQYIHITHWMPLPEPPKGE